MVSTRQSSNMGSNCGRANDHVDAGPSRRNHNQVQASSVQTSSSSSNINLLDLPPEIFEKICSYLDYNTIALMRPVCHQINLVCGSILNSSFQRLQNQMLIRFQAIKAQMPRRESARRNHPLACESDIIETLHMRLTLLQMSFGKHIERKHCCFFPGEILDEVNRILHYIKVTSKLAKPYKVTDELFDLSTMAMEYFKERIEPTLPEIAYFGADFLNLTTTFSVTPSNATKPYICLDSPPLIGDNNKGSSSSSSTIEDPLTHSNNEPGSFDNVVLPQSNMVLRKRIRKIKQGMKRYNNQLSLMRRDLRSCKAKIAEQQKQIVEYAKRLDDNDKKNEETSRKFSTFLQELNKCKTELQYWRSKSPAIPACSGCGQSMAMPPEDFQALSNQGIISDQVFVEELNFIPIDSLINPLDNTEQNTSAQKLEQSSNLSVEMAPPKVPVIPSKRKASDDNTSESVKKTRRTVKSRQAKRSKI